MADQQWSHGNIHPVQIDKEMKNAYIDYAMSVIVMRALPDVRDGLKPVYRRILYAMHETGMTPNKPFKKSARIVGDVLGKYHPHGDRSVYDATVRLAQDFNTRYLLVDGHGNFGSIDGDSAAAMRYTEVRMAKITTEMLADIDKETVDFMPNYDESLQEPTVLPAKIPNLLINGSSGIAVGMATNIPPHNLNEVCNGLAMLIDNPDVTVDELMTAIKGPDFPTGALILGREGIKKAYSTGRGSVKMRARATIEEMSKGNNGGIARGATPESSGSYGFVRLEGDLLRTEVAGMSVTAGVYGAAGHSSVDVKDDDGSRAGTVRDDAGSLGGYLNLIHNASGLWADIVALGTRHSMKASTDNNDFRARGWGWLGSLETGLPFSITDNLMLEPRLQYTWQGLSLDDGKDNAGYVKFGHGSAQHVRAGFRLGSYNDMTFGEGTSSRAPLRDSAKHSVRELPVNWWVQPSVIRTFSSRGDMRVGTSTAGSGMTFSPSQNGTSLDLQAGLEARVRGNITLGVQAGYAHSINGSSAEGYNSQATLNVTF